MPIHSILMAMADPRGRCNRRGLLLTAVALLALEIATGVALWLTARDLGEPLLMPVKVAALYLAWSVTAQRLHDVGLSAWRIVWAALALLGCGLALCTGVMLQMGPDQMALGETGFAIVFAGIALPMLAAVAWLHFARGEPGPNRFGPAPDGLGFSRCGHCGSEPAGVTAEAAA